MSGLNGLNKVNLSTYLEKAARPLNPSQVSLDPHVTCTSDRALILAELHVLMLRPLLPVIFDPDVIRKNCAFPGDR